MELGNALSAAPSPSTALSAAIGWFSSLPSVDFIVSPPRGCSPPIPKGGSGKAPADESFCPSMPAVSMAFCGNLGWPETEIVFEGGVCSGPIGAIPCISRLCARNCSRVVMLAVQISQRNFTSPLRSFSAVSMLAMTFNKAFNKHEDWQMN